MQSSERTLVRHLCWAAWALALFAIYLLTGSRQYDHDTLPELAAINRLDASSPDPAHMLYVRLGVAAYGPIRALEYTGDALRPMQCLNAAFGAGTILIVALVLQHFTTHADLSALVASAAGLSYAFWTHTVEAFFIIPAAFFAVLALWSALQLSEVRSAGRAVAIPGSRRLRP